MFGESGGYIHPVLLFESFLINLVDIYVVKTSTIHKTTLSAPLNAKFLLTWKDIGYRMYSPLSP